VFHPEFKVRITDITDGTSSTVMIGERPSGRSVSFTSWYSTWGSCVCSLSQILDARLDAGNADTDASCPRLTEYGPLRPPVKPENGCDRLHFWSYHTGGANFAFADGSVRFLRYSANAILPALATRSGGEIISADF
jgi:prepilin-type processing-associated H-X9-DG protein